MCANRRIYGINQRFDEWPSLSGGWSDRIYLQPNTTIVLLPDDVSFEQVIALGCAGPTVIHGLLHRARVQVGDTVIVQGAGTVRLAAALFARLAGAAKVITSLARGRSPSGTTWSTPGRSLGWPSSATSRGSSPSMGSSPPTRPSPTSRRVRRSKPPCCLPMLTGRGSRNQAEGDQPATARERRPPPLPVSLDT
jgi:hypothetical protein